MSNQGNTWGSFLGQQGPNLAAQGLNYASPTLLDGSSQNDLWAVTLHEAGHTLGLDHPDRAVFGDDCSGATYNCPVMTQATNRVSYWPQIDDSQGFSDRFGDVLQDGDVQWATFQLNSDNTLVRTGGWTNLLRPDGVRIRGHIARVSCRPALLPLGPSPTCVVTVNSTGGLPRIYELGTDVDLVTAGNPVAATVRSEQAVDVAFGRLGSPAVDRFLAVGKRPVDGGDATAVVTYRKAAGGTTLPASLLLGTDGARLFTHTEPRVSFHEPASRFVVAFPDEQARVRIVVVDAAGATVASRLLTWTDNGAPVQTPWPVEVACDSHLIGTVGHCKVFVVPYGTRNAAMANFRAHTFTVTVDSATGVLGPLVNGNVQASYVAATPAALLLADASTYGENVVLGQRGLNTYLVTQDRLREFGTDTIAVFLDGDGNLNPPDVLTSSFPAGTGDDVRKPNLMSWDWDESYAQIVAVRIAD